MLFGRPVTKNISGRGRVRRPTASALDPVADEVIE